MSQGDELFAAHEDGGSRPSFETALRGYDKRQVDQYLARADNEIAQTLAADRERAYAQIQQMVPQLQHLQAELNELRQRPPLVERASFRHLGPMVDQILALAEKQAEAIVRHRLPAGLRAAVRGREGARRDARARPEGARRERGRPARRAHSRPSRPAPSSRPRRGGPQPAAAGDRGGARQAEQELAQWKADGGEGAREHKAAAEQEIAQLRNVADQKNAALHAEAQQYAADLRRRASEQAASHQQQLAVVQQELQSRQQALGPSCRRSWRRHSRPWPRRSRTARPPRTSSTSCSAASARSATTSPPSWPGWTRPATRPRLPSGTPPTSGPACSARPSESPTWPPPPSWQRAGAQRRHRRIPDGAGAPGRQRPPRGAVRR